MHSCCKTATLSHSASPGAKANIRDANIPYRVPEAEELTGPNDGLQFLAVVYLIFNEGYKLRPSGGASAFRTELLRPRPFGSVGCW